MHAPMIYTLNIYHLIALGTVPPRLTLTHIAEINSSLKKMESNMNGQKPKDPSVNKSTAVLHKPGLPQCHLSSSIRSNQESLQTWMNCYLTKDFA